MRSAPLGAWLADDLDEVARQARSAAEVTHAHPEGIAGAVAVAVAAGHAARGERRLLEPVRAALGPTRVAVGVDIALRLAAGTTAVEAAACLGNGSELTAADTVPFCLWVADRHADDYESAVLAAASAGGDVDTTCAIVGGIVGARLGADAIPAHWRRAREPLPI